MEYIQRYMFKTPEGVYIYNPKASTFKLHSWEQLKSSYLPRGLAVSKKVGTSYVKFNPFTWFRDECLELFTVVNEFNCPTIDRANGKLNFMGQPRFT